MKSLEFLTLLGVGLENLAYNGWLNLREVAKLGGSAWWWRLRAGLERPYLADPPFRVCRRESPGSGLPETELIFGETPLLTGYRLFHELGIGPQDRVVDLGCGRGGLVLLAAVAFGARGLGLEVLPTFVERARGLAMDLGVSDRVEFEQGDFRKGQLPEGTLFLLSGTCLGQDSWAQLKSRLIEAPAGTRVLATSAALPPLCWETLWERKLEYSWGRATTYLQRRLGPVEIEQVE